MQSQPDMSGKAELFKVGAAVKLGWRHDAGMFLHE